MAKAETCPICGSGMSHLQKKDWKCNNPNCNTVVTSDIDDD